MAQPITIQSTPIDPHPRFATTNLEDKVTAIASCIPYLLLAPHQNIIIP